MDLSALGTACYEQIAVHSVVNALRSVMTVESLLPRPLSIEESLEASRRALVRLNRYYTNLEGLLDAVPASERDLARRRVIDSSKEDTAWLREAYAALTSPTPTDVSMPGMALFLEVGGRGFALLPPFDQDQLFTPVFMAPSWRDVVLTNRGSSSAFATRLTDRIRRSNYLWQRERWSVLPAADTAELGTAAYFNDIALHATALDGWVDAFWGVQSGLRISVPIDDSGDSRLVLLLTSFVPDALATFGESPGRYVIPLDETLASAASAAVRDAFAPQLSGLSFAASILRDFNRHEVSLLDAGMRMISHYYYRPREQPDWSNRVAMLVQKLHEVSPPHFESVKDLEVPERSATHRLSTVADSLPHTQKCDYWRHQFNLALGPQRTADVEFPLRDSTVGSFVAAIESQASSRRCSVVRGSGVAESLDSRIAARIHPLLMASIADNLLKNATVTVAVDSTSSSGSTSTMIVSAYYPEWSLSLDDETQFMLKPLISESGRERLGFYLTAQVLWKNHGTVEYYRIGDTSPGPLSQAILVLRFPLN